MKQDSANRARKGTKKALKKNPIKEKRGKPGQGFLARQSRKVKKVESREAERTLANAAAQAARAEKKKKKKRTKTAYLECRELGVDSDVEDWQAVAAEKEVEKAKLGASLQGIDFSRAVPFVRDFWNEGLATDEEEIKKVRQSLGIKLKAAGGPLAVAAPMQKFSKDINPLITKFVAAMRQLKTPTNVQKQCIPAALQGFNILGIAPTGSGKTLAFLLPALPHVAAQKAPVPGEGPIALVVEPTRELAMQVCETARPFRKLFSMSTQVVYGGQDKSIQVDALHWSGCHFLVATPGRLIDLLEIQALKLGRVTYFVIDEADRMLSLGFEEQLNSVSSQIRPDRQTLLFSATFPGKLREVSAKWLEDPVTIRVNVMDMDTKDEKEKVKESAKEEIVKEHGNEADVVPEPIGSKRTNALAVSETITQKIEVCSSHKKPRKLIRYVNSIREREKNDKVRNAALLLVFCTKIKTLKFVVDTLTRNNFHAEGLHGQLPQWKREDTLKKFKCGQINILVATDVAARGLHINSLKHVINYDFPANLEQYCHRIGRTGRNGKPGFAYSFFTRNFAPLAKDLVSILERYNQPVDQYLKALINSDAPVDQVPEEDEKSDDDVDFDALSDDGLDEILGDEEDDFFSDDEAADKLASSAEEVEDSDENNKENEDSDEENEEDHPEDEEDDEDDDVEVVDEKSYGGIRVAAKVQLDSDDDDMEVEELGQIAAPSGFQMAPPVFKEPVVPVKPKAGKPKAAPRNNNPDDKKKKQKGKLVRPRGKRGTKKKKTQSW